MTPLVVANAVLWVLVIALSLVVLALVRQVAVLHARISPVGALMLAKGLKVGEPAPPPLVSKLASGSRIAFEWYIRTFCEAGPFVHCAVVGFQIST